MREPQLCVTVTGRTMAEIRRARDAATVADIVEVRLDGVSDPDPHGAIEGRRRPVIVTCRPTWEGGAFDGSEEERQRILTSAYDAGAEFVDVEAAAPFADLLLRRRQGRSIVISMHRFGDVPSDLADRAAAMRASGAEVVKIAVEARRLSDLPPLLAIAECPVFSAPDDDNGHVLVAMGNAGVPSRVLAARLGNRWTYAGDGVAPGQMPPERLLSEYRFRRIHPDAAIYGVVGRPVMHSLSPLLHNAAFAALELNAVYVPLEAEDVQDFVTFADAFGVHGASVTAPFKVPMLSLVDQLDAVAQRVGAINTLIKRGGKWSGANTDVEGFLAPLAGKITLNGTRATVLGAGGAARAVAVALAQQRATVTISARRGESAGEVASLVGGKIGDFPPRAGSWDVLVNTTPPGALGDREAEALAMDGEILFDLVYAPCETPLMRSARAAGCLVVGGIEMLVAQAERQFELWTGQRPPSGLMRAAAGRGLGESYDELQR